MLKHARAARPHRPHRRQREPADSEAGHRVSVAADGGPGDHRPQEQAAAAAARPASTTSTSTSSRSGIRTTRRCCRSAIAASPPAIEAAERNGGNWRAAVAETGVDADFYIFRDRSHDRVLPWDIIDGGMKTSFFQAEFDKGLREEWTLPPKRQKENAKLLPGARLSRLTRATPLTTRPLPRLVLRVRLQDQIADPVLRRGVADRPQQREAAALAVDRVLTRRERDVAAVAGLALPDREANQLQALRAGRRVKCSSASASFPGGLPLSFGTILIVIVSAPLGWRRRAQDEARQAAGTSALRQRCARIVLRGELALRRLAPAGRRGTRRGGGASNASTGG